MHIASVLSVLCVASYTLANPLAAVPRAVHLARQATPTTTSDFSVIHITIPEPTHTPHNGGSDSEGSQTINITIPTCSMTAIPDQNGYVPPGTCHSYYEYYPSFSFAVLFTILFGIVTTLHIAQAAIYKKPFCWVICMAATWEFGAFFTRALSTRNQQSVGLVFVSQIFVLLAPLWVNAFDYMLFARMVHYFLPSKSLLGIRAGTFALIFVALDIFAFFIQLVGGTIAGPNSSPDQIQKGINIYMGGIGLQEFFIVFFVGLVIRFQWEVRKVPENASSLPSAGGVCDARARRLLYTLYASLGLITIRIIQRLIEHSKPATPDNALLFNEWYFYVFEALPMLLAIGIMNVTHPGTLLKGPESNLPKSRLWQRCKCCASKRRKSQSENYVEIEDLALAKANNKAARP